MNYFLLLFFSGVLSASAIPVQEVRVTVNTKHKIGEFDPRTALGAGIDGHWQGESLKLLSPANVHQMLGAGLGPVSLRLRTELAVEAWHWNPKGVWSVPTRQQGYWTSDAKPDAAAPILVSYGYKLPRRGNTLDEANDDGYSMLDDGDPSTFWKSNPYLTKAYTGESDTDHPQWVILDFGKPVPLNTIRIDWGEPYARKFQVEYATKGRIYFGGHPGTLFSKVWHRFPYGKIDQGEGTHQELRLSENPISARYLRIWMTEGSGTAPRGADDPRDHMGYAIREIGAGVIDKKGFFQDAVSHAPGKSQTVTYASSTDPWHRVSDRDPHVEQPGIDLIARSGVTRRLPVMLSIPVLYDTPQNAVALADYAKKINLPVNRYELGEEPDGQRVSPTDFGVLYAQTSRVVRKVIPRGILGGPSFVTLDIDSNDDKTYRFDKRWWVRDFRKELSRQGEGKNFQFLSFEWYPFDDVEGKEEQQIPLAYGMLERTIKHWKPPGLPLVIGEANYSVFSCQHEVDLGGALLNSEIAAQFLCSGGSAHYFYSYEPNKLEESSGSWGNQMMLMQHDNGSTIPLATYYALKMLTQEWLDPRGGKHEIYQVKSNLSQDNAKQNLLSLFALKQPDGSWALLAINKSPTHSIHLTGFNTPDSPFSGTCRLTAYSEAQYHWVTKEADGYPSRNLPPFSCTLLPSQSIILPPWSLSVIRKGKE